MEGDNRDDVRVQESGKGDVGRKLETGDGEFSSQSPVSNFGGGGGQQPGEGS